MQSRLNPYLNFDSNAREAMEFYQSVFGGELELSTFGEAGMASDDSENGFVLMASDRPNNVEYEKMGGFSVSLSGDSDEELTGYYEKLSEGGNVVEPLALAPWGDKFGYFSDRFGVSWMVNISGKK